jgi:hypothetical protein
VVRGLTLVARSLRSADDIVPANISNSYQYNCTGNDTVCDLPEGRRMGGPNGTARSEDSWLYVPQHNLSALFADASGCAGEAYQYKSECLPLQNLAEHGCHSA